MTEGRRQGKRMEEEKKVAVDVVAGEEVAGGEDMLLEQVGEEEKRN